MAPGFDARDVGGTSIVDRRDGETLRASWRAALGSHPDLVGVISWNEFSENTHIEPSTTYGDRYLDVLRDLTGAATPASPDEMDSSGPQGMSSITRAAVTATAVIGFIVVVTVLGFWRRRRDVQP